MGFRVLFITLIGIGSGSALALDPPGRLTPTIFCMPGKLQALVVDHTRRLPWFQMRAQIEADLKIVASTSDAHKKVEAIRRIGGLRPIEKAISSSVADNVGILEKMQVEVSRPFESLEKIILESTDAQIQRATLGALYDYYTAVSPEFLFLDDLQSLLLKKAHQKIADEEIKKLVETIWREDPKLSIQKKLAHALGPDDTKSFYIRQGFEDEAENLADEAVRKMNESVAKMEGQSLSHFAQSNGFRHPVGKTVFNDATKIDFSRKLLGDEVILEYEFYQVKLDDGLTYPLKKPRVTQLRGAVVDQNEHTIALLDKNGDIHRIDFDGVQTKVRQYYLKHQEFAQAGRTIPTLRSTLHSLHEQAFSVPPPTLAKKEQILKKALSLDIPADLFDPTYQWEGYWSERNSELISDLIATTPDPRFQKRALQAWAKASQKNAIDRRNFFYFSDELASAGLLDSESVDFLFRQVKNYDQRAELNFLDKLRSPEELNDWSRKWISGQGIDEKLNLATKQYRVDLRGQSLEQYAKTNGFEALPDHFLQTNRQAGASRQKNLMNGTFDDSFGNQKVHRYDLGTRVLVEFHPVGGSPVILEFPLSGGGRHQLGMSIHEGSRWGTSIQLPISRHLKAPKIYWKKVIDRSYGESSDYPFESSLNPNNGIPDY